MKTLTKQIDKKNRLQRLIASFCFFLFMVFMTSFVYAADEAHEHGGDFSAFSLVQPLGITALSLVLLTFLTGLFRRKLKTRFMTIHKIIAWAAIAVALTHGTLVFILFD